MRIFHRSLAASAITAVLASCVPRAAPPPIPVEPPRAPPAAAPLLPADWRDWPRAPGTWSYRRDGRGSIALFGEPGAEALLTLRCDASAGRLFLSRAGTAVAPLTVRTTSATRVVPVQPIGGMPPYVAAALANNDPLLDAMGFSRGRFVVEQSGSAPLAVPDWPEIERVTQDCRG